MFLIILGCNKPEIIFDVNNEIKNYGVPEVPFEYFDAKIEGDSFFGNTWLFISFRLNHENLLQYEKIISGRKKEDDRFIIGVDGNLNQQVIIILEEDIQSFKRNNPYKNYIIKEKVSDKYIPWWNTDKIKNGSYFAMTSRPNDGYKAYFDYDNNIVYLYTGK